MEPMDSIADSAAAPSEARFVAHDAREHARRLLAKSLVCDMVFVYEPDDGSGIATLARWADSGFRFVSLHPAGDRHTAGEALHRIARARREIEADPGTVLVTSIAEIEAAAQRGLLGVGLHLEGFRPLERDLNLIDAFYALGVRFCHPVFNLNNSIGGGCVDDTDVGLTRFGRAVVREMNRVGMIVDGSHASHRTTMDMMECSSKPVIFSHVACAGLRVQPRNVRDDQIHACARTDGVIGITAAGYYLGGDPTPELFFRHIDYVVQMIGPRHVAIGLDYCANVAWLKHFIASRPDEWPNAEQKLWEPVSFFPPEDLSEVAALMVAAGYRDEDVAGILGENFLRVCKACWR